MSDTTKTTPPVAPPPIQPETPPLATWRKVLVGLIFVVLVAGVVIGVARLTAKDGSATTSAGTTAPTVPTTLATPDQPPQLFNVATGDNIDWDRMVRSVVAYQQWLYDHRRPDLLANIVREDNPSYQSTLLGLTNLAGHPDWHNDPVSPPTEIRSVRFESRPASDRAIVVIQFGPVAATRVVDGTGKVVYDEASHPATATAWTLLQDAGSARWRLAQIDAR